jgi:CHAD domain-containing protein
MLKRQLKSLGRLRDHHVQQVFFRHQAAKFPELLVLRSYFKRREGKLLKTASREIRRFKANKLGKRIRAHIEDLAQYSRDARRQNQLVALVVRRAGEAFAEAVERRQAITFSDLSTIHRIRVAFKKFRYIVESIPPDVSGLSKRELRNLALYQRRMGNVQDLAVIQATLTDLLAKHEGLEGLLSPFCAYLQRRRSRALLSFRKSADKLFQFWPPGAAAPRDAPMPESIAVIQKA